MNVNRVHLFIMLQLVFTSIFSQTIEIGTSFTSSNALFYKNVFGVSVGFDYDLKKQYLFAEIKGSLKNNSYFQIAPDFSDGIGYVMEEVNGKMYNTSIRSGIAQKIVNTKEIGISLGIFMSLNYFKLKEDIHTFNYDTIINSDYYFSKDKLVKSKIGGGGFIDLELKQIISKNISLFSRCTCDIVQYDGSREGALFSTSRIYSLGFYMGLKIRLNKLNACP